MENEKKTYRVRTQTFNDIQKALNYCRENKLQLIRIITAPYNENERIFHIIDRSI